MLLCAYVQQYNRRAISQGRKFEKEWVESLKIKKLVPQNGSFVCLDHFKETDLKTDVPAGKMSSIYVLLIQ